jgi:hypothetical protein
MSTNERRMRARLAASGFIVVDPGKEAEVLAENSAHTRRRISTLPGGVIRGGSVTGGFDGAYGGDPWWA